MSWLLWGLLFLLLLWVAVLAAFAGPLQARWREPVFRFPILVFESDDWGAGPLEQTEALGRLAMLLQSFQDQRGRHPVMSLGVVLEVPDTKRIHEAGLKAYYAHSLGEACFARLRDTMKRGAEKGLFALQLHGLSHYWAPALMQQAAVDANVSVWLTGPELPRTEQLPPPLQSRWIDGSRLPSTALERPQIENAVGEEAAAYRQLFDGVPQAAVATTFIWNEYVEQAWKQAGVEVVITPGRRATCRDAAGRPACVDKTMLTGDQSRSGQCYLVRDVYFEPTLGHAPQRLLEGLVERTGQGRACLVEIHRFNFLDALEPSLEALRSGIALCLARYPNVRFLSPLELANAIKTNDVRLLQTGLRPRLRAWLARLAEIPRFPRLAQLTGLAVALKLMGRLA